MKKLMLSGGIALSALAMACSLSMPTAAKDNTYTGDIMDSQCAKMSARSHWMMNQNGGKVDPKACTLKCVKQYGSTYVLYDATTKTVYQLDDQKTPEQFAGEKVTVTGTLDDATKTIHVTAMKSAS